MHWFLIVDTSKGLRAFGPFEDEDSGFNFVALMEQEKGPVGFFDIFPSLESDADLALKEWYKEKRG